MIWADRVVIVGVLAVALNLAPQLRAQEPPTDDTISFWVLEALREDPRVRFANIQVSTENGIVTLAGSVFSLAESQYARLIALKIQGVRGVSNRLTVDAEARSNADVAADVRRRILQSSSVKVGNLEVTADAGEVLVKGTVNSLVQSEEVTLLASDIRGVLAVQNELRVVYVTERSDDDIAKDIEAAMQRDVYLNTLPINITVKDGRVTLTGSVGKSGQPRNRVVSRTSWPLTID